MEELTNYITLVGYISTFYLALKYIPVLWLIFRAYFIPTLGSVTDLKKYGEWVVVTGATDGIGKEYAKEFAKRGFKIVLISRNKSKLEAVAMEIREEFNVVVKIVCFNFTCIGGYEKINDAISELDVGVLINNVGMVSPLVGSPFLEIDPKRLHDMVICNVVSDIRMTHMICKGMMKRKRGLILHISSLSIYPDFPRKAVYPATKKFMEKAFNSLRLEHDGVIDHQLVTPGYVSTKSSDKLPGFTIPTAEEYVKSAMNTIGIMNSTCGYFSHELLKYFILIVPTKLVKSYAMFIRKNYRKK